MPLMKAEQSRLVTGFCYICVSKCFNLYFDVIINKTRNIWLFNTWIYGTTRHSGI